MTFVKCQSYHHTTHLNIFNGIRTEESEIRNMMYKVKSAHYLPAESQFLLNPFEPMLQLCWTIYLVLKHHALSFWSLWPYSHCWLLLGTVLPISKTEFKGQPLWSYLCHTWRCNDILIYNTHSLLTPTITLDLLFLQIPAVTHSPITAITTLSCTCFTVH